MLGVMYAKPIRRRPISLLSLLCAALPSLLGCGRSTHAGSASTAQRKLASAPSLPSVVQPPARGGVVAGEGNRLTGHAASGHGEAATSRAEASFPNGTASRTVQPGPVTTAVYAWHADATINALEASTTLRRRFESPPGFVRVALPKHSFGSWLRGLPLAAAGTGVRAYNGALLLRADHPHLAAVTTLDTGARNLQQCADAVMRLHAEWLWSEGHAAEASYGSGAGPIAWKRYLAGGYPKPKGNRFVWGQRGARQNTHANYRKYLDVVFSWSNTVALARQGKAIARGALRPGDFFVVAGSPGHTVLVLDVAENADGQRRALLGQSFMPAQSFHVLRPSPRQAWFSLNDKNGVKTPFWPRFPWTALRRLDG